jgi:tellurite resistance protein
MFNLGRLAAALLNGGRGGRSAEARVVRAVTQVVTGEAPTPPRRHTSTEASRRRREAEAWGLPAPPPRRRRPQSPDRVVAEGAAVLAEAIARKVARGSVPPAGPAPRGADGERGTSGVGRSGGADGAALPRSGGSAGAPHGGTRRRAATPVPAPPPPSEGLLLVRAMVAAAKADGRLDPAERKAILERLEIAGLSVAERDVVLADFDRPATAEALAKGVKDALLAARIYAAAAAAAGERCPEEQAFLAALAQALRLDAPAIAAIEQRLAG